METDQQRYLAFSLPRLPPPGGSRMVNPIYAIRALTWQQQAMFWSGWLAWFADAYDFFCVSLTVVRLDTQFGVNDHSLTTAITLTLLFRSVGAFMIGLVSDRFGRKWPLIVVLLIIAALQTGTGFVNTFHQFLAVRSLFGIAMGGVWGLASATSMENMPAASRGVYSGFMQVGYPGGYLIASVVNLFLVPETPQTWRPIYWVGAGISVFAAFIRLLLPESAVFERAKRVAREANIKPSDQTRIFFKAFAAMVRQYWGLWLYGLILMSGMNFLAHGSQDLYTTFMQRTKGFSSSLATKANIVGECGAVTGAILGGYISQFLGRRLTLVLACVWACAFIPLWIIPNGWGSLSVGAFFFQTGVNIGWGTIAVYLNELSPPAFRGLYPGTVYQLGNAASSAAAQIEATAGLHITKVVHGVTQPDYGTVQAIMAACSAGLVLFAVFLGPERHSAHFEEENTAVEEGVPFEAKKDLFHGHATDIRHDEKEATDVYLEG
ncbi:carboxylic acid transporter protein [Ramaria rubella]|nr:carboxylic acid transporter protein [Ramaria rubella]